MDEKPVTRNLLEELKRESRLLRNFLKDGISKQLTMGEYCISNCNERIERLIIDEWDGIRAGQFKNNPNGRSDINFSHIPIEQFVYLSIKFVSSFAELFEFLEIGDLLRIEITKAHETKIQKQINDNKLLSYKDKYKDKTKYFVLAEKTKYILKKSDYPLDECDLSHLYDDNHIIDIHLHLKYCSKESLNNETYKLFMKKIIDDVNDDNNKIFMIDILSSDIIQFIVYYLKYRNERKFLME